MKGVYYKVDYIFNKLNGNSIWIECSKQVTIYTLPKIDNSYLLQSIKVFLEIPLFIIYKLFRKIPLTYFVTFSLLITYSKNL